MIQSLIVRPLGKLTTQNGGPEGFSKVRGACRIENLKYVSKSEFMGPSYGQESEKVHEHLNHEY